MSHLLQGIDEELHYLCGTTQTVKLTNDGFWYKGFISGTCCSRSRRMKVNYALIDINHGVNGMQLMEEVQLDNKESKL